MGCAHSGGSRPKRTKDRGFPAPGQSLSCAYLSTRVAWRRPRRTDTTRQGIGGPNPLAWPSRRLEPVCEQAIDFGGFELYTGYVDTRSTRPHGYDRTQNEMLSHRSPHEEWSWIVPLLPRPAKRGGKPSVGLREAANAIRYVTRPGCGWLKLLKDFPSWQTVYW